MATTTDRTPTPHHRKQRGQGMSEYIIITALIAVAGVGVFSAFGDTIAGQDGSDALEQSDEHSQRASDRAATESNLQNFNEEN
jgi:hypothetical protein